MWLATWPTIVRTSVRTYRTRVRTVGATHYHGMGHGHRRQHGIIKTGTSGCVLEYVTVPRRHVTTILFMRSRLPVPHRPCRARPTAFSRRRMKRDFQCVAAHDHDAPAPRRAGRSRFQRARGCCASAAEWCSSTPGLTTFLAPRTDSPPARHCRRRVALLAAFHHG